MRQVVLDTETTGLEYRNGDRVIEIGCVELIDRKLSGRRFHRYINPERAIEKGAQAVHGLDNEFLQDKPKFRQIADEFLAFIHDAELVIHNAPFDVGFLNNELGMLKQPLLDAVCPSIVDTLRLARELHPGRKNSLDALCERYAIDNAHRTLHGALLDAELLAEVYVAMTRGQESLIIDLEPAVAAAAQGGIEASERPPLLVLRATDQECLAHDQLLQQIAKESKGKCVWLELAGSGT